MQIIHAAGDLGLLIDYGDNQSGSILRRSENPFGDVWRDYEVDGEQITARGELS
jgi:hypothetical protein